MIERGSEYSPEGTVEAHVSRRGFLKALAGVGAGVALTAAGLPRRVEAEDKFLVENLPEVSTWPNSLELATGEGEPEVVIDVKEYLNGLPLNTQASMREAINTFTSYATDNQINISSFAMVVQGEKRGESIEPTVEPTPTPENPDALAVPAYFSIPYEGYFVVPSQEGKLEIFREDNAKMAGSVVSDISSIDEKTIEMVSALYIKPNGDHLVAVDRDYPHLGVITSGIPNINEAGQNEVVWSSNYQILGNSRLRALSYSEDGAIGKEAMPAYVRINDEIRVDELDLTLELASAMSLDGANPFDNIDFKFTPEFAETFRKYTKGRMGDLAGYTIRLKYLDETDKNVLEYMQAISVENEDTVKALNIIPGSFNVPLYGWAGHKYPEKKLIEYNIFLNRVAIKPTDQVGLMNQSILLSIIYADKGVFTPWRGSPSDQVPDATERFIALGAHMNGEIDPVFTSVGVTAIS